MTISALGVGNVTPAARGFAAALGRLGVSHVVTVPDNTSAPLLRALADPGGGPPLRTVFATREGEAMGLAAGLWLGGGTPSVLIQNTGLLEAGDALRGTLARMGAPVPLLVTCRGYPKARSAGVDPGAGIGDGSILVRNDLDSVAHMTEPTLRAWGIPFQYLRDPGDLSALDQVFTRALEDGRPVALLLDTSFN
jgi:sulfopyruvate decarboxylase TPP-binding subunit